MRGFNPANMLSTEINTAAARCTDPRPPEPHPTTHSTRGNAVASVSTASGAADDLLGLDGTRIQQAELRLGDERILLVEHLDRPGRPIPFDSRNLDHWFQHRAIVVSDMDAAYARLRSDLKRAEVRWVSRPNASHAWIVRDPDGHGILLKDGSENQSLADQVSSSSSSSSCSSSSSFSFLQPQPHRIVAAHP
jgi:hypothetical protein